MAQGATDGQGRHAKRYRWLDKSQLRSNLALSRPFSNEEKDLALSKKSRKKSVFSVLCEWRTCWRENPEHDDQYDNRTLNQPTSIWMMFELYLSIVIRLRQTWRLKRWNLIRRSIQRQARLRERLSKASGIIWFKTREQKMRKQTPRSECYGSTRRFRFKSFHEKMEKRSSEKAKESRDRKRVFCYLDGHGCGGL